MADAHAALGFTLADGSNRAEALIHFQDALKIHAALLDAQPTVFEFQHRHALALCSTRSDVRTVDGLQAEPNLAGAEWDWSASHPNHLTFLARQGDGHARLAATRIAWGWSDSAVDSARRSVNRFRRTASARPDSFIDQRGLALALTGLADMLVEGNEAVRDARGAVNAWKKVLDRLPAHPDANDGLARLLTNAPDRADRDPQRAELLARRALSVVPEFPRYRVTLSLALLRLDKPAETIATLAELVNVDPDAAIVASLAYHRLGNLEPAHSSLSKGIELADSWIADDQSLLGPSRSLLLEASALIGLDDAGITR